MLKLLWDFNTLFGSTNHSTRSVEMMKKWPVSRRGVVFLNKP